MIFDVPLPWTTQTLFDLEKLLQANVEPVQIKWWWSTFHHTGGKALNYAAKEKMREGTFLNIIEDLSCPTPPPEQLSWFRAQGLLDIDDRIVSLDPELAIQTTWAHSAQKMISFNLFDISDLSKILIKNERKIELLQSEDYITVSKWLTAVPSVLKTFHDCSDIEQLKVIELLIGPTKSFSVFETSVL